MAEKISTTLCYVVKAEELLALNYLPERFPHPVRLEWINRATNRILRPSTREQLLRTFHRHDCPPSVAELRRTSGIRAIFANEDQRRAFTSAFSEARVREEGDRKGKLTAIFPSLDAAEEAAARIIESGISQDSVSMLWRSNAFLREQAYVPMGHSKRRVAATISSGGLVGAAMGISILVIPGLGPVAAAGAVLASAYSAVAAASGIIGATGAALATMLTDLDVDEYAYNHLENELKKGRIFFTVKVHDGSLSPEKVRILLEQNGGSII